MLYFHDMTNSNEHILLKEWEDGAYGMKWDEQNQVIRIVTKGVADEEMAKEVQRIGFAITEEQGHPVDWICDLSEAKIATKGARAIFKETLSNPNMGQLVYYGGSKKIATLANALLRIAGKENGCFIKDEESALALVKKRRDGRDVAKAMDDKTNDK